MSIKGVLTLVIVLCANAFAADTNVIEEQLKEIGEIPNREIISVQKKYTRKQMRHELTPLSVGGVPFGTVRHTLTGGAGYALHWNDWFATDLNFTYTQNFFTSFEDDINSNKASGADIRADVQKLVLIGSAGIQITPWYGKASTYSRWIVYMEPVFTLGFGLAKTETNNYFTFYPGVGFRVFFREWVSARLDFRDYIYWERSTRGTSLRNNFSLTLSLSFWLPKMPG